MGQDNSMLREARYAENRDKVADKALASITKNKPHIKKILDENEKKIQIQNEIKVQRQIAEINNKYDKKLEDFQTKLDKGFGEVDKLVDQAGDVVDAPGQVTKALTQAGGNLVNGATDLVASPMFFIGVAALGVLILKA